MEKFDGKKIVLAGGGSGGHVTPLIALGTLLRDDGARLLWIGGNDDPSQAGAQTLGIPYAAITTGKWRRYWSIKNIFQIISFGKLSDSELTLVLAKNQIL